MGFNQATKICIDNSEWMRNNDYSQSRFQAQTDAISLNCVAKTQVLKWGGEMNLVTGIQIAQLALKHHQNKNQQQRIMVFAGRYIVLAFYLLVYFISNIIISPLIFYAFSPIKYEKKALEMIGKKLKRIDDNGKPKKLEALLASVNNDSSHIVHVPLAVVGASDFEFGVDPNIDPELALALRFCIEEERARQEAAAKRATEEARKQEKREEALAPSDSQNATATEKDEDDALLKQALALSMNVPGSDLSVGDAEMSEAANGDQELAMPLKKSMQEGSKDSSVQSDVSKVCRDQSFMSSILSSLPGVDPNDPNVKDLLASLRGPI
ncbi:hypothetical protein CXB51_001711 [Gossypium anomalum]|uniref:VWFA domain-containing protein n=1 Tax=Gossypium anomalum TaxID=47600 RepID=A0A8J6DDH2_9ROSI|nr:hypothetical protein CXB51_001711 [Gossypium anomalum]